MRYAVRCLLVVMAMLAYAAAPSYGQSSVSDDEQELAALDEQVADLVQNLVAELPPYQELSEQVGNLSRESIEVRCEFAADIRRLDLIADVYRDAVALMQVIVNVRKFPQRVPRPYNLTGLKENPALDMQALQKVALDARKIFKELQSINAFCSTRQ